MSSPILGAWRTVTSAAALAGLAVGTDWALREWDSGAERGPDYAERNARAWAEPDLACPDGRA